MLRQRAKQRVTQGGGASGLAALAMGLALVGGATAIVAVTMDGAHNGSIAGNEAMTIAAVWGLGGLLMASAERWFPGPSLRHGARGLLAASLLYLVMGALMGNARWAVPPVRFFGYLGVIGSTWATEALLLRREPGSDVNGLLSLTAAGVGYYVCAFEVVRWLAPVFTLPLGDPLTPELYAWQASTQVFITAALWAAYALAAMVAGRKLRSPQARLLSAVMLGTAIGYAGAAGLTNLTADLTVRAGAIVLVAASAMVAARMAQHAPGERHPRERLATLALAVCGIALPTAWVVLEIL